MKIARKLLTLALALTMVLSVVAIGGAGTKAFADDTDPVEITVIMNRDISDLSPWFTGSASRRNFLWAIYDTLMVPAYMGQPAAEMDHGMAKSWDQPDPQTINVELFDYIHDVLGNPIKAEDVVYSYEYALNEPWGEMIAAYLESIEATGDYALTIHLANTALGGTESVLSQIPIVSKQWHANASAGDRTSNPATTGSYKVEKLVSGSSLTLVPDENYWQTDESMRAFSRRQPYDKITLKVVLESNSIGISMKNKEADVARGLTAIDMEDFPEDEWTVFPNLGTMYYCVLFNNDNSVFADNVNLRKAVLTGIDAEQVRLAFGNTATSGGVCKTMGTPNCVDYQEAWNDEEYFDYDADKAAQLMADAGYPGGAGLEPIRVLYCSNSLADAGMTVVQYYLTQLGFQVTLIGTDQAGFDGMKYDDTAWDICIDQKGSTLNYLASGWNGLFNPAYYSNGSVCFTHDDKLEELVNVAADATTHTDETVSAVHEYLKENAYCAGLFYQFEYYVGQKGLQIAQDFGGNCTCTYYTLADDYHTVVK